MDNSAGILHEINENFLLGCPLRGRTMEHARTHIVGYADGDEAGGHPEAQGREMGAGRCCLPHGGHIVRANGTGEQHFPPLWCTEVVVALLSLLLTQPQHCYLIRAIATLYHTVL